jgi:Bacterial Ig-like domain (group 2)
MRRFPVVSVLAALLTAVFLVLLAGCGGGTRTATPVVASITLSPTTISLNEGGVATLSAAAKNSAGAIIAADITFTSSNPSIATVSSGGLICGGVWDSSTINCNATSGQAGVGQVTITATSGNATATATAYVHLKVDRVVVQPLSGCVSMGQVVNATATACSASAPGCSPSSGCLPQSPCDITSTVGPIALGSNDLFVVANSAGIEATFDAATASPTYSSGGTITGSKGQTCNLSNFGVGGSSGIDPTFSPATNSPTYTSGGTINGSPGQTCNLSNFNGVTGATATVTLTATNTIASGAHLTVTAEGFGATTPPTSATLSNGTASCSGTATVITALIGIGGGSGLSVVGAEATVALTGTNTIASGTQLTVTASGYGATTPPTTATLTSGTATCSGTANVITALNSAGVFTAESPGATSIFGSVSGVNGVSVPYITCPVVEIKVHDAGSSNTSFTLSKATTQPLTADVYDSTGQYIKPALTWGSSSTASVTVATGTVGNNPATITAVAPGTASITASCSYPNCNRGVPPQYSYNVVTATVSGATTTTVFAASTNSTTLVPISSSTNAAGTAVTLPYLPNSMMTDPAGANLYLGSSSGLMVVNIASTAVTTQPIPGTIIAISPDSNYMLISDTVNNVVYYYTLVSAQNGFTFGGTTTSAAYTPDSSFDEFVSGNQLITGLPLSFSAAVALPYTAHALGVSAQGSLTYVTGSAPGGIDIRSTCNSAEVQTLSASSPTLIGQIPNGTGAVAADSPKVDVISSPGTLTTPGCPVLDTSTISSVDMGVGAFNAAQLFFSSDSSRAWIISSDLPKLLLLTLASFTPSAIPYAGGATAYNGGITLDGSQVYVGTSDGTVHRIDVASQTDVQQIAVSLKDANGNPVVPNLVYVEPH